MKKIIVKCLIYHSPITGENLIGAEEYDGQLTDENILGAIHETGKTIWLGPDLWTLQNGNLIYHIKVEKFIQYQKRWYETLWDQICRI